MTMEVKAETLTYRALEDGSGVKQQAPSNKLDKTSQIIYDGDIMNVRKKLVKEIKKTNPDLADEIQYMSVKEFKALMEVFNVWCRL